MPSNTHVHEQIVRWLEEEAEQVIRSRTGVTSIHINELDPQFRDPARWEEGMLECLRSAEHVVVELPLDVAVGLPIGRPAGPQALGERSFANLLELRTYVPPVLCLFRPGREPWEVTVREFGGQCQGASLPGLELYLCEWWDPDDAQQVGSVWIQSTRLDARSQ